MRKGYRKHEGVSKKCQKCGSIIYRVERRSHSKKQWNELKYCGNGCYREAIRKDPSEKKETKKKTAKKHYKKNCERILAYQKEYYIENKEMVLSRNKRYRLKNKEEIKVKRVKYSYRYREKARKTVAEWYKNNRERVRQYYTINKEKIQKKRNIQLKERRKKDIQFRLSGGLRSRLGYAIRDNQKVGSAVKDLGCTIPEFKSYLETLFQSGMTWENWSRKGWHIDHKIPLSRLDLTDREQFLKACHYTNLQPMWRKENLKKSNKII